MPPEIIVLCGVSILGAVIIFGGAALGDFLVRRSKYESWRGPATEAGLRVVPPTVFDDMSVAGESGNRQVSVHLVSVPSREVDDEGASINYLWTAITTPVKNPRGYRFIMGRHLQQYCVQDLSRMQVGLRSYLAHSWPNGFAQFLFHHDRCGRYLDDLTAYTCCLELGQQVLQYRELGDNPDAERLQAAVRVLDRLASDIEAIYRDSGKLPQ